MMAVQQQNSNSGPMSLISCVSGRESSPVDDATDTKNESKKKRFHPFRNLRRMFRRKNRHLEVSGMADSAALDGDVRGLDPRCSSADTLLDDDGTGGRRRSSLAPGLSLSHDSVFKPDRDRTDSGNSSSDLDNSSLSIPILIPKPRFAAELADVMRRRVQAAGADDSDDDLGLPRSRCSSATDYQDKYGDRVGKSQSSCSEGSLLSTGSSFEDDLEAAGAGSELDLRVTRHKLSHSAAKHKMAVRPRRNHAPATKRHNIMKSGTSLPVTPEVSEETNSWTPSTPAASPEPTPQMRKTPSSSSQLASTLSTAPSTLKPSTQPSSENPPTATLIQPRIVRSTTPSQSHGLVWTPPTPVTPDTHMQELPKPDSKAEDDLPKVANISVEEVTARVASPDVVDRVVSPTKPLMFGVKTPLASLGTNWTLSSPEPAEPKSFPVGRTDVWSKSASLPHGAALSSEAKVARSLSSAASSRVEVVPLKSSTEAKESELKRPEQDVKETKKEEKPEERSRNSMKSEILSGSKSLFRVPSKSDVDGTKIGTKSLSRSVDRRQRIEPIDIPAPKTTPPAPTWPASMVPSSSPPKAIWPEKQQPERTGIFIKNERTRRDSRESKPPIQKSHSFHKDVADEESSRRLYLKNRRGSRKEEKLTKKSMSLESIGNRDTLSLDGTLPVRTVRSASSDSIRNVVVTHEEPRYANLRNLLLGNFEQVHHGYENIEIIELVKKEQESKNNTLEKPKVAGGIMKDPKSRIPEPEEQGMPEFMKVQLRESRSSTLIERRRSELQVTDGSKSVAKPFKKQKSLIDIPVKEEVKIVKQTSLPETVERKHTSLVDFSMKEEFKPLKKVEVSESKKELPKEEVRLRKENRASAQAESDRGSKIVIMDTPKDEKTKKEPETPKKSGELEKPKKVIIADMPQDELKLRKDSLEKPKMKANESVDNDVTLRRKSEGGLGEEPELLKVFARRSLKVKDDDEGECPRSRDSDKENDVEEKPEKKEDNKPAVPLKPTTPLKPAIASRNSLLKNSKQEKSQDQTELKNRLNERTKPEKPTVVTIIEKTNGEVGKKPIGFKEKRPEVSEVILKRPEVPEKVLIKSEVRKTESEKKPEIITPKFLRKPASCTIKSDKVNESEKKESVTEKADSTPMSDADPEGPGFKTIQDRKAEWERRLQAASQ